MKPNSSDLDQKQESYDPMNKACCGVNVQKCGSTKYKWILYP